MSFAVAALSCLLRKANEILTVIMAKNEKHLCIIPQKCFLSSYTMFRVRPSRASSVCFADY